MKTSTTTRAPRRAPRTTKLDWSDAAAVQRWGVTLATDITDAIAAGEDQTRAPGERDLGRREARRILMEAEDAIAHALTYAGFVLRPRARRGAR